MYPINELLQIFWLSRFRRYLAPNPYLKTLCTDPVGFCSVPADKRFAKTQKGVTFFWLKTIYSNSIKSKSTDFYYGLYVGSLVRSIYKILYKVPKFRKFSCMQC